MDINTTKINGANAQITAVIKQDKINANIDKIAKDLSKTTNIPGFRKGKVPLSAVKKQYGDRLVQDAEAEAMRDVLSKGLEELNISNDSLIGEPHISQFDKVEGKIEVTVKVATRPEIELGDYALLASEFSKPKITAKAVTDRIQELAKAQAPFVDVEEDRELIDGDTAVIDFGGSVEGKPFEGGQADDFSLTLGSGQFIPGFEEQLIGMKKGDEKTIDVTFPENYQGELAGKPAQFKVKVNGIQMKEKVRMDAALAKKMIPGEEDATMDMLKEQVETQMINEELSKLYNDELKPSLLETYVAAYTFDLPEFVVEQEMDMALNKKAQTMSEDELNAIKADQEKVQELRETFRADAERSVKATFIIDALAQREGIAVTEEEVMQTIYYEAMQMGQDPSESYEQYKKSGYLPAIQMAMVEDKVLSKILNSKLKED